MPATKTSAMADLVTVPNFVMLNFSPCGPIGLGGADRVVFVIITDDDVQFAAKRGLVREEHMVNLVAF